MIAGPVIIGRNEKNNTTPRSFPNDSLPRQNIMERNIMGIKHYFVPQAGRCFAGQGGRPLRGIQGGKRTTGISEKSMEPWQGK